MLRSFDKNSAGREGRRGDPLVLALDTNKDGAIAADEVAGAVRSLAMLDGNGDGQLTMDEVAPAFSRGGGGGGRRPKYRRPASR